MMPCMMRKYSPTFRRTAFILLLLALGACGEDRGPALSPLAADAVILAFGDSLTYGTGAKPAESYPAVLESLVGRRVVRSGVPGEVTAQGVRRLPAVLSQVEPALLVLIHGGNDMLRRGSKAKAAANLRAMIEAARERGVEVLLVGVPRPVPFASEGAAFYREIADDLGIPYLDETLADILTSPSLKADLIHPNARGYRKLAEAIADRLRRSGAI
jgi:lysophospholipase L1-like esterase